MKEAEAQEAQLAPVDTRRRERSTDITKRHELLIGVKPHFLKTRTVENDILRPYKRLLVDVLTSAAKLDDALDAAQALFEALSRRGFHVGFTPVGEHLLRAEVDLLEKPTSRNYHRAVWAPERPTVVYMGGTSIGLSLFEMTEEVEVVYVNGNYLPVRDLTEQQLRRYTGTHHWRSQKEHASGRLCLQAYCPSGRVKWSKRWQETKPDTFHKMLPSIINELESIAPVLMTQLEEARIRADEAHRQWQEELRLRKAEAERVRHEKNKQESRRDLLVAIASFDEARRVLEYFKSCEVELDHLTEDESAYIRGRIRLAKELVGTLDPLALLKSWKAPDER